MKPETLKSIIEAAGYDARSYSGRGMCGKQCLAFDTDDSQLEVVANLFDAVALGTDDADDLIDLLRKTRTDSMGRGTVFYFPGVSVEGLNFDDIEEFDEPGEGNPAQWR